MPSALPLREDGGRLWVSLLEVLSSVVNEPLRASARAKREAQGMFGVQKDGQSEQG